jgi:hypothetical protein
MLIRWFGIFCLSASALVAMAQVASADPIDPAFVETATNSCPSNCGSVTIALDPFAGGKTTVEYIFNSTISSVVAGDVKIDEFGGSTVGDLIRFENISDQAVAFIYSGDVGGGLPADVGLPTSFQTDIVTISENASGFAGPYTPTTGQPGFCLTGTGTSCAGGVTYGLTSSDVPEPLTLSIFGVGVGGVAVFRRRRKKTMA